MIIKRVKEGYNNLVKEQEMKRKRRELQKRRASKYGQAKVKHAKRGVSSCMVAGLTSFFLLLMFSAAYISREDSSILLGFMGIGTIWMSISGVRWALEGFKEREKDYITCKIGVVVNGLYALFMILVFVRGLF